MMARGADISEAFVDINPAPLTDHEIEADALLANLLGITDDEIDAEAIRSLSEDRTRDEHGELIEVTE